MKRRCLLFALVLSLLVLLASCGSRTLDARDLARIELTGADGFGSIFVTPDQAKLASLLEEEASGIREDDEKGLHRLLLKEATLNSLIFSVDRLTDLKNGDEVSIRCSFDEKLAKSAGLRIKKTKFTYKVEGLEEARPIDVRNQVQLDYTGYNGRGIASLRLSDDLDHYRSAFEFIFESPDTGLSNGDRVDLKVVPDNAALTASGRIARESRLSFRVEGLLPMTQVDLFSDLVLIFDGTSGQGTVSFDTSRLPADWVEGGLSGQAPVSFTASPSLALSNDDLILVEAQLDWDWFGDRGLALAETKREYQVSGLKEYPRNLDQVDLLPLFDKLQVWLDRDMAQRIELNYWNRDYRAGQPVSIWDSRAESGVVRIYYGYDQGDRSRNFVALFYKLEIEGTCLQVTPYQSFYQEGDHETASLYLVYVVDQIMYDREAIDDFREVNLRLHSQVELDAVSLFKAEHGGQGIMIVDVPVPDQVAFKGPEISVLP